MSGARIPTFEADRTEEFDYWGTESNMVREQVQNVDNHQGS